MCHNKEVSFIVFIFALSVAIGLFTKNEPLYTFAGLYILALGSMQLVEFGLHLTDGDKTSDPYQFASWCILLAYVFQFAAASSCVHYYQKMPALCVIDIIYYAMIFGMVGILWDYRMGSGGSKKFDNAQDCKTITGCKLIWDPFLIVFNSKWGKWFLMIAMLCYLVYVCWATYIIFHWSVMVLILLILLLMCTPYVASFIVSSSAPSTPASSASSASLASSASTPASRIDYFKGPIGSGWCLYVVIISCLLIIGGACVINGPNIKSDPQ